MLQSDPAVIRHRLARFWAGAPLLFSLLSVPAAGFTQPASLPEGADVRAAAVDSLPGVERVAWAERPSAGLVLSGGLAHGLTEDDATGVQGHDQSEADLSLAYSPLAGLGLAYRMKGRLDYLPGDPSFALNSALTAHYAGAVAGPWHLGGRVSVLLPAADSVGGALSGLGGQGRLLLTYRTARVSLGGQVSFTLDRARSALSEQDIVDASDRVALEVSEAPLLGLGVAAAYHMDTASLLIEATWDPSVGDSALAPSQAPMWLRFGYRFVPGPHWALSAVAGFSPSARPEPASAGPLVRVEPRVWLGLRVTHRFGSALAPPADPSQAAGAGTAVPTAPPVRSLRGRVIDPDGAPIEGAQVSVVRGTAGAVAVPPSETDPEGGFLLSPLPSEAGLVLRVQAPGFAPFNAPLPDAETGGDVQVPPIVLAPPLPEGQIEGTVRNFRGRPIAGARVRIDGGKPMVTGQDGTFALPVRPGDHTLRISAAGYLGQSRAVRVEERGVTVLLIDLRRRR